MTNSLRFFIIFNGFVCSALLEHFYQIPANIKLRKVDNETSEKLGEICGRPTADQLNSPLGRLYPWSLSVTLYGQNNLGGVLISPLHILTAAHPFLLFDKSRIGACLVNSYKTYSKVTLKDVMIGDDCIPFRQLSYFGPLCKTRHLQKRNIRAVYVDRRFGDGLCINGHDWAIIELDEPLNFDENVRPICLPNKETKIGSDLMAVSWGRPKFYLPSESLVREIPLKYDPNCTPSPGDIMPTRVNDYLCAKSVEPINRNTKRICHGDSGSGLQTSENGRSTLVGITSFGSELCLADQLTRFTQISHYINEICELTGVCYMN